MTTSSQIPAFQVLSEPFKGQANNNEYLTGIRNLETSQSKADHWIVGGMHLCWFGLLHQAHDWFLEIAFVCEVGMRVCVHPQGHK